MSSGWDVFNYERNMATDLSHAISSAEVASLNQNLRNAITESLVLHTRILCDILLSKGVRQDDINLSTLLPDFTPQHLAALAPAYGDSRTEGTPCWQFNKLLAHPTTHRSLGHDYSPALNRLLPHIGAVLSEIDAVRNRSPAAQQQEAAPSSQDTGTRTERRFS